jgi:GTPase SAR1 family protein
VKTEARAGLGYIDYLLLHNGLAKLVVEAKRDGRDFGITTRAPGQAYKLSGPVFAIADVQEGVRQAIEYSAYKNAELACVTNGHEWVVFRSNRLGDGKDTTDGYAFVFPSLDAVESQFNRFYDLLSYETVPKLTFRAFFQEAEGLPIRHHSFQKQLRPPSSEALLRRDPVAVDMDRVMTSFFQRLTGDSDPEMIRDCFVVTKESQLADAKLIRISEELIQTVRTLDTSTGEQLAEIISRAQTTRSNNFVVLVGTKGAGKSTFVDRFFAEVLPREVADQCVVIKVNVGDSDGDEKSIARWLNHTLLESAEAAIFEHGRPNWDEIIGGIFFDEYQRWSTGPMSHLYEHDRTAFRIKFGEHAELIRQERPQEYIKRLLGNVVRSRKRVPCLILDNADHFSIDFQERVFQYVRAIYENELCLVVMPITDKTSWQLSQQGALQSFESESLYLPTPPAKVILERRVRFLVDKLSSLTEKQSEEYFLSRGIRVDIKNLAAFAAALQRIFVETGAVSKWISGFANHDVRRVLELSRDIVASPHIKLDEIFTAYIVGSAVQLSEDQIKEAIIKTKYDIYPTGRHKFVQNVFALHTEIPTTPLLGVRLLQLLRDAQFSDVEGKRTFVSIDQIYEYFNGMGCERRAVSCWLNAMLKTGLCWNYDPTVNELADATRVELTPSGTEHLFWGTNGIKYVEAMASVTSIADEGTFNELKRIRAAGGRYWTQQTIHKFVDYLIGEDGLYCSIPAHDAYKGQAQIYRRLASLKRRTFQVETSRKPAHARALS